MYVIVVIVHVHDCIITCLLNLNSTTSILLDGMFAL